MEPVDFQMGNAGSSQYRFYSALDTDRLIDNGLQQNAISMMHAFHGLTPSRDRRDTRFRKNTTGTSRSVLDSHETEQDQLAQLVGKTSTSQRDLG